MSNVNTKQKIARLARHPNLNKII